MKSIGILGGMGPLATADLYRKIVLLTSASRDSEHIRTYIDSNTGIPDRNAAILYGGEDPRPQLIASARKLQQMGADFLIIPCNTSHFFYEDICASVDIPVINMIEETALEAKRRGIQQAVLLATDGTIKSGVYAQGFAASGVQLIYPGEEAQRHVMDLIFKGIKGGDTDFDIAPFLQSVQALPALGAQAVILGCTELPIAFQQYGISGIPTIDATTVLAESAIRAAGGRVKAL